MSRLIFLLTLFAAAPLFGAELLVCGWDEVYILDIARAAAPPSKIWSWKTADRPELPPHIKTRFKTTADCKPIPNGRILIVASDGGVAVVERSTRKAIFWGDCVNTHSAELLPGERIAVACSTGNGGNRLAVFDARVPERELFSTELYSGHGVVWDSRRNLLWALGGRELRSYALADWNSDKPSLALKNAYPLPDPGGHELIALDDSPLLLLTALRKAWFFDRDAAKFSAHPELCDLRDVKSISIHPATQRLAYTQADRPDWWTSTIRFLQPAQYIKLEGERIYKVRWVR